MTELRIGKNHKEEFTDIFKMIKSSPNNVLMSVNTELINLYWGIGKYIDEKVEKLIWRKSVVTELSEYIFKKEPSLKSFLSSFSWRIK